MNVRRQLNDCKGEGIYTHTVYESIKADLVALEIEMEGFSKNKY